MDTYSISYTTPSRRNSSKIYQDLKSCHTVGSNLTSGRRSPDIMEESVKHRTQTSKMPHIGIVGAGVSGLRCADVLIQQGFQVTILEGRDRIGGRMHQITLPETSHLVDSGPNWIHGTDHNPILDLAKETQTPMHSWGESSNLIDEHGQFISGEEAKELNEVMWGIIVDAFKYSNQNTANIDPSLSLFDWFEERVKESLPEGEPEWERRRKAVLQSAEMWGAFVGSPITTQSLKFFWLEECIDGENLFCAGTYQKILSRIAAPALSGADLKLSTRVIKIASQIDTFKVSKVAVMTDSGSEYLFDEVIMTAPLGWLQQNKHAFTPSLPHIFAKAIDNIGYGCLEKVYISFPNAFWLATEDRLAGFTQWLSPKYAPPMHKGRYNQEAVELSTLPSEVSHPTLLFYIFGPQSRDLSSQLSALESSNIAAGDLNSSIRREFLTKWFMPYISKLPNYSAQNEDCIPTSAYFTNWVADNLAGNGSYSNFQTVGKEQDTQLEQMLDKDIETLREGLPGRGVWFAGEHTSPFVALGTVTGAWWSGESVAVRIIEAYGYDAREEKGSKRRGGGIADALHGEVDKSYLEDSENKINV